MKELITKDDIALFFDVEAESARKKHEQFMSMPIEERIRRRKAVDNVYWDPEYSGFDDSYRLYRLKVTRNLSDFKEGDSLLLHKEDSLVGQECQLYEYDEDDNIIVAAYSPILNDSWKDIPLVLDKNVVDLRKSVYEKYLDEERWSEDYWKENVINGGKAPGFEGLEACEADLRETEEWLPSPLTAAQHEAVVRCMATDSHYMIQGPPGTGKSFVLGVIILEELLYFKHRVVVVGPNHMAVNNTLKQVLKLIPDYRHFICKVGQSYYARDLYVEREGERVEMMHGSHLNVNTCNEQTAVPSLYGMTPYALYTSRARGLEFDTLVIDEAGQMTIPLAQMAMRLARKVVFAGDHKQLPPIVAEEIEAKMRESVFQRVMTPGNCSILDTTFRMCGPICNFVSDLFYDGQLVPYHPEKGTRITAGGELYSFEYPVVLYQVDGDGRQVSTEETAAIVDMIEHYCVGLGLGAEHIAVLSPFRAQVADIRRGLKRCQGLENQEGIVVDTIDKLQGQEREVVIVSMAAGDMDYMNEMGEFLYNPNKLNVAFSRARNKLVVVGNFKAMENLSAMEYPHIEAMLRSSIPCRVGF